MYCKGKIVSKLKKNAKDETKTYEMYYDYNEPVKYIKPHRILAINRGEKENVLNVNIEIDNREIDKDREEQILFFRNMNLCVYITLRCCTSCNPAAEILQTICSPPMTAR